MQVNFNPKLKIFPQVFDFHTEVSTQCAKNCGPQERKCNQTCTLRPCERRKFQNFVVLRNSEHVFSIFNTLYFPYHVKIEYSEFHETEETNKPKCFRTKTPCIWVKNPVPNIPYIRNIRKWLISNTQNRYKNILY